MKKHLILLLMAIAAITANAQTEKRLALVVGNSEYLGKGNSLANPAHDAEDVSAKLNTLGFDVTTLIDGSILQMKDAIQQFSSKAKDYDIAFFYYSGHGLQTKGNNYMMPVDAELDSPADIEYACYPLNQLLDKLDESNCPMKIIVLDACRNNPFTKGWYRGSTEEGLVSVQSPKGTFITFATAAGSVAYDGTGRNSPYTMAFLQTLDTPNLSLFEFFNTVGQLVLDETQNKQDPWVNYSTMKGSFYFNKRATPKPSVVQASTSQKPSTTQPQPEIVSAPAVTSAQSSPAPPTDTKSESLTFTVNDVSFVMKRVEGGTFWMGAQNTDPDGRNYDSEAGNGEGPVHSVTLSNYYIGEAEVTQALWKAVMGNASCYRKGDDLPIYQVSHYQCRKFISKLNELIGCAFRMPTEAEWEFAARGGKKCQGFKYSGSNNIKEVAWFDKNSRGKPHKIKEKKPNELGLFDMSGNIQEWCCDRYDNYSPSSLINPKSIEGSCYVMRGGEFASFARHCRNASRGGSLPETGGGGLRLCLPE